MKTSLNCRAIGILVAATVSLIGLPGGSAAQTPKINTHDASIPHATKTTKSNLRKAGGQISKASRKAGKAISQASRNVQKQASRTVHKKP